VTERRKSSSQGASFHGGNVMCHRPVGTEALQSAAAVALIMPLLRIERSLLQHTL